MEKRLFLKQLTPAEVGITGTHEKYIRLPNNFEYETFFQEKGNQNGSVIQIDFEAAYNGCLSEIIPMKFVFYANSNHEKRIPSLGALFERYNVKQDDTVCLESITKNGKTSFSLSFLNESQIHLYSSPIIYTVKEEALHTLLPSLAAMPLQQIYYGAPGTGKSYAIDNYTQVGGYAAIRTTFHPDSDYSTFVGAYKPTMKDGRITYSFVKQAFLKAYLLAWKKYSEKPENVEPQFLVIEEINRGNCAQIFGDLFQLLDRQDNGFSSYPIEADADLQAEIKKSFEQDEAYKISNNIDINGVVKHYVSNYGQNLTKDVLEGRVLLLPNNLYIWATMNTSDQSLFPIDSAFKRRWDWKYVKISDAQKGWMILCGNEGCDWWTFVDAINKEIADKCESEDKKLGYFFCKPKGGEYVIDEERFVGKVLFYLWNDVFKDIDTSLFKLKGETEETPTFDAFYTQNEKGETIANTEAIRQFLVNVVGDENLIEDFTESNTTVSTKGSPRFVLDGNSMSENMMNTVRNMVKKYADAHPAETADGIMNVFNEVCNDNDFKITNDFILETEAMRSERMAQKQQSEKAVELDLGGRGKLYVNRYWTRKNREAFIRKAKEMQWGIIEQVNQ